MFDDKVWAMIHNRFQGGSGWEDYEPEAVDKGDKWPVGRWVNNMSAADWWIANEMGDPYAENEQTIAQEPMPDALMGFFERLHHAYNSTMGFFDDKDEREWYEQWVLPFDDPLTDHIENDTGGAYESHPMDYFGNMRNYFENEAPSEMFNHKNFNKVAETFAWSPSLPIVMVFQAAINKTVI